MSDTIIAPQASEDASSEITPILDIETFAQVLGIWHQRTINTLLHMGTIPEGTEVLINDTEKRVLTGDFLSGYKLGLDVALAEIKSLPIVVEFDDDPAKQH